MRMYLVFLALICACDEQSPTAEVPPLSSSAKPAMGGAPSAGRSGSGAPPAAAIPVSDARAAGHSGSQNTTAGVPAQVNDTSGTGGVAAPGRSDVAGTAAGSGAPIAEPRRTPCLKKASQLVVVGDSYLNWLTHDFPNDLQRELGHDYRFYAEPGASMASGGIATPVPQQLTAALAEDPDILASVMTGGGNDILLSDVEQFPGSDECKDRADSPSLKVCQDVIAAALAAAERLMETGSKAGIKDVVYVYYPHIPGSLLGVFALSPNEILDYSMPMARSVCNQAEAITSGAMRCHFLDLQPIFEGHSDWFADDGIHENATGSAVIAKEIVALMKAKCIAQPEESGCCAP